MQPVVESAWIAVSGGFLGALVGVTATVIVARAGFRATTRGLAEQIEAERRSRVWEKQAAAYSEVIAAVRQRQREQHREWDAMILMHPTSSPAPAPADWPALEGRLFAFASPAVMKAFSATQAAAGEARVFMDHLLQQRSIGEETGRDRQETNEALQRAASADEALVELIRVELHAGAARVPEPVLPLTAGSAEDAGSQDPRAS